MGMSRSSMEMSPLSKGSSGHHRMEMAITVNVLFSWLSISDTCGSSNVAYLAEGYGEEFDEKGEEVEVMSARRPKIRHTNNP